MSPAAGPERPAVRPEDGPEREVTGFHARRKPARPPSRLEHHAEMQRLASVDHVEDALRAELRDPVPDGGQVGRRVVVAAVALLHDQRNTLAVRPHDVVEEDTQGPVVAHRHPGALQLGAHLGEVGVVEALADRILVDQQHVERVVHRLEVALGLRHDLLPGGDGRRIAGLECNDPTAGPLGELRVAVVPRPGVPVQAVEPGHGRRAGVLGRSTGGAEPVRPLPKVLDEHAELRAPIADVILAHDLVPTEVEDAGQRIADDRGAQVADVHLLGDVRLGVVDHGRARNGERRHAQPGVEPALCHLGRDRRVRHREVDEPGPGHLAARHDAVVVG